MNLIYKICSIESEKNEKLEKIQYQIQTRQDGEDEVCMFGYKKSSFEVNKSVYDIIIFILV